MNIIQGIHKYKFKSNSLKLEIELEENFTGEIIIFDKIKCGQKEKLKNDRYVLKIPKNGVLYYSGNLTNKGYIDNIFIRKNGNSFDTLPNLDKSMFWKDTKKYYKQDYNEKTLGVFNLPFNFNLFRPKELFVVSNKKTLDTTNWSKKIIKKLNGIDIKRCK